VNRVIYEQELQNMLQLLAGDVSGHKCTSRGRIHDTETERAHGERIIDGCYACLAPGKASAHQSSGGDAGFSLLGEEVRPKIRSAGPHTVSFASCFAKTGVLPFDGNEDACVFSSSSREHSRFPEKRKPLYE
jgi:hypothetical protein